MNLKFDIHYIRPSSDEVFWWDSCKNKWPDQIFFDVASRHCSEYKIKTIKL